MLFVSIFLGIIGIDDSLTARGDRVFTIIGRTIDSIIAITIIIMMLAVILVAPVAFGATPASWMGC